MPRLDKTGPRGLGPMTGRAMGNCNTDQESDERSFFKRLFFRNRGRGRNAQGRGMGRRTPRGFRK